MAGFNPTEPRDGHGRWNHLGGSHMMPHGEAVAKELAILHRQAHANIAKKHAQIQMGEAFRPRLTRVDKLHAKGLMAYERYKQASDKFYTTKVGKAVAVVGKDRFTRLVPPGSKRDLAIRGAAAVASLGLSGGLSALNPSFVFGKAWRAGDWAYRNYLARQERRATSKKG